MELADFREILVKIRILTVDLVELLGKFECTSGRVSSNEESEIPQIFRLRRFQWNFTSKGVGINVSVLPFFSIRTTAAPQLLFIPGFIYTTK